LETKANYVAVGAFVMICVFGIVVTLLWLAGLQYSQEYAYYQTYFKGAVTGLGKGTTVRYNGIEVGRVDSLQFDPNDPQTVIVTMQLQPNLNIREDSEASIESEGLAGGSYVEISGGTANSPLLVPKEGQEFPVIKAKASTFQQLEEAAPLLLSKLNAAADKINDVLSPENRRAFAGILTNLNKTTSVLAARSNDIDNTLRNVNGASAKLGPMLADADVAVKHANGSLGKIDKLADDADGFITGPGLGNIADLVADLRRLSESLNKLTDQLNHEPTKLLFGDRRKGYAPK
jgi:phospholipid/cholesterol/gamma-HCH transport system substrate-binding protein